MNQKNSENELFRPVLVKKSKKKRIITWSSFILFFILLFSLLFYIGKTSIQQLAEGQFVKKGVNSEISDVSLLGKIHLKNLKIPVDKKSFISIEDLSGRLPVLLVAGHLTLKNIQIVHPQFTVTIPNMDIDDISFPLKSNTFSAYLHLDLKKILNHVTIGAVQAPIIKLKFTDLDKGQIAINQFKMLSYSSNLVKNIQIETLDFLPKLSSNENSSAFSQLNFSNINLTGLNIQFIQDLLKRNAFQNQDINNNLFNEFSFDNANITLNKGMHKANLNLQAFQSQDLRFNGKNDELKHFLKKLKDTKTANERQSLLLKYLALFIEHFTINIGTFNFDNPQLSLRLSALQFNVNKDNTLLPTSLHTVINGGFLNFHESNAKAYNFLAQSGYDNLQFSTAMDLLYSPKDKTLNLKDTRLTIKDAFILSLNANLQNVENLGLSQLNDKATRNMFFNQIALKDASIFYNETGILKHLEQYLIRYQNLSKQQINELFQQLRQLTFINLAGDRDKINVLNQVFQKLLQKDSSFLFKLNVDKKEGIMLKDLSSLTNLTKNSLLDTMHFSIMDP